MRYRFGELELDPDAYVLRRSGTEVTLQPKMFELLRHLIERRERVVTKEELLDALWPGEHVNDSAVAWTVSHVRTALGQERGERLPIETIHGRGYRFRAPVEQIEGAAEPERTSSVPAAGQPAARPLPTAIASSRPERPFVGRGEVMLRLRTLLSEARGGAGRIALLCGEAGIGKTRCAEELMQTAAQAKLACWMGRAVEDAGAPVFWPWIQIVRKVAVDRPLLREGAEKILEELSAFEGVVDATAAPTNKESARERNATTGRFLLMDAVTRLLLRATETEPAVMLLDDMQWADSGTLDLLAFLASELGSSRLFVLVTHRGIQPNDPRMARLLRRAERFDLAHLTPEEVGQYLAALTDVQTTPEAIARAVHRATSGNPLFMQETVRALVAEHGDTFTALDTLELSPPDIAHDVLRTSLERLPDGPHALLTAASVLGETFDLSILQSIAELEPTTLVERLDVATAKGFVVQETPQRARFAHALIRRVLYDAMGTAERMRFHRRAAVALEALPSIERRNGEIASHFYRSLPLGDYGRVAHAAERAAYEAKALYAHDEAARFYQWALEAQALDPGVTPRSRAELLLAAGAAQRHAGRDGDSRQTLSRMFELSREHGYADLLVRGARSLRPTVAMATIADPMVRGALEAVLQMKPEPPPDARVFALAQLAFVPPYSLDLARSKELSGNAVELARKHKAPHLLLEALRARLYSLSGPDDIDALLETANEMLTIESAHAAAYNFEVASARIGALLYRGDIEALDRALVVLKEAARDLRLPEMQWYCDRQLLQRKMHAGDYAAVTAELPQLLRASKRMGISYGPWFVDILTRRLQADQGGVTAALRGQNFSIALDRNLNAAARARMTRSAAEVGQYEIVRESLDSFASQGFASLPKEIAFVGTVANLGMAAWLVKDSARVEQLYALLLPYAALNTPDGLLLCEGSASRFLGLFAAFLERDPKVVDGHFQDALAMNERMGFRPTVALTLFQYARWLLDQDAKGVAKTRARGIELAQRALALAEALGCKSIAERTRQLLA